ncbi:Cof-type HAD-IIB family hydrolase [Clostridium sardiniense]|uniref:Cof-type HAD-IIB family hydrolase n=1 Tax=Clostridium sardiniense TaxID=29369 RepID=UPI003D327334
MSIKLICIDMDGTLLKDQQTVSNNNKEAIKEVINRGIYVAITTGRVYDCAKMYSKEIGLNTPIISSNGAFIGGSNGEVIYNNPLNIEELKKFYSVTKKYGLMAYLTTNFGIVSDDELPVNHVYNVLNKKLPDDKKIRIEMFKDIYVALKKFDGQILKGVCVEKKNKENLIKARKELESLNSNMEIVASWNDNFEIMQKGSTKGDAVKRLAEYFNISREEVMCIGDSENDFSMIEYAGIGVAMGNAIEKVKFASDYITDTNINDGVAKAIKKFVL